MAASTKSSAQLQCKNLQDYLKALPIPVLDRLYNHPATCLAVFRDLPLLARHYVMRILFVDKPVSHVVVTSWVNKENHSWHLAAVKALGDLRVWCEQSLPGGLPGWILGETFRENLKIGLLGGGKPWIGSGPLTTDKHARDVPFLNTYAKERWECVLHYMVGSKEGVSGVSRDVVEILSHSGLMKRSKPGEVEQYITPAGFQFLLLDMASQVWFFMLQYLDTAESRGLDLVESLSFLFQLGFSSLGKDYSTEGMTETHLRFLQHLRELGLVYQRKRKSQRYYPTMLAINLATGASKRGTDSNMPGYIVVETNSRVYAYTDSSLQVALLALFCEMVYRFPNLAVANITRDSVREALSRGITANQMIHFLRSHAHPQLQAKKPVLPPTVSDQIQLWELERDRFKFSEGVLYNQFLSQSDFELLRDYARDLGVLMWENPRSRMMVVDRSGHDEVKRFWKRHKHD